MAKNKKYNYTKEQIQNAYDSCNSVSAILRHLGAMSETCKYHRNFLKKITEENNIDLTKYKYNRSISNPYENKQKRLKLKDVENSNRRISSKILHRIVRESGREYKCEWCSVGGEYNGRPLTLQLDHIDGNPYNNKLSNLRYLCPNCHSQTKTFGSKNAIIKK